MFKHLSPPPLRAILLLLLLATLSQSLPARDFKFTHEGKTLTYTVISEDRSLVETKGGQGSSAGNRVSGNLEIPSMVSDGVDDYTVVRIGARSFIGCSDLHQVTIPNTVTEIDNSAFNLCTKLTDITLPNSLTTINQYVFDNCWALEKIVIPNSVTTIEYSAFNGCKKLSSVTLSNSLTSIGGYSFSQCEKLNEIELPNSLLKIGDYAFHFCPELTYIVVPEQVTYVGVNAFSACKTLENITLPNSLTTIGKEAFSGCEKLKSIIIPPKVTVIGRSTFFNCSSLSSVILPNGLKEIDGDAFKNCSNLVTLTLPASLTKLGDLFIGCTFKPLLIYSKKFSHQTLSLSEDSEIIGYQSVINGLSCYNNVKKTPITPYEFTDFMTGILSCSFRLEYSTVYNRIFAGKNVAIKLTGSNKISISEPGTDGVYTITNYEPEKKNTITLNWTCDNDDVPDGEYTFEFTPNKQVADASASVTSTQTTLTFSDFSATESEIERAKSFKILFDRQTYEYVGKPITIVGLNPGERYPYKIIVDYGVGSLTTEEKYAKTKSLNPTVSLVSASPTSLVLKGEYTQGDVVVKKVYFEKQPVGETATYTGLKPQTSYSYTFYVETDNGKIYDSAPTSFTTQALVLRTLQPCGVSQTSARVSAETNISDEELNVGFQWKKDESSESVKPSEGGGAIHNGTLEGYITNLQTDKLYIVRPFYRANDGTYFYGDWKTLDPSIYSFYAPIVYTLPVLKIDDKTATVRAYVLPGSDIIIRQGVQYWQAAATQDIKTVDAMGQMINAVLYHLEPDTKYVYRAFAETDNGFTYGEEMSFRTTNTSGVEAVVASAAEATVLGYYNLSGTCSTEPHKGFNIVLYSDGTTKKMIVR